MNAPAPDAASASEGLDVLIIGAGLSGIGSAALLRRRLPHLRVAVVEARSSIGGTWDLFRYPGVRSDSDMFTLGYRDRPWQRPRGIADGPDIRRYIQDTATTAGVLPLIRFETQVLGADWHEADGCWQVRLRDTRTGTERVQRARFIHQCAGYYRYDQAWRPQWDGEADFRGRIVHPQFWPEDLAVDGLRVAVIGSGATAMTLVPALAARAAHVTMVQRSPTYVVSRPAESPMARALERWLPRRLAYGLVRWRAILEGQFLFHMARRRPAEARRRLLAMARAELPAGYDVERHFGPRYDPWDQRVCLVPDGDLFRAIREGRASVVTDTIERFTPEGLRMASGEEVPADLVVTATGLQLLAPGLIRYSLDGVPVALEHCMLYKGLMLSGLPNLITTMGYTNASWTLRADLVAEYLCRLLARLERRGRAWARVQRDPAVSEQPALEFTSGYVQRAVAMMPKQGDRDPWRVRQNYLHDLLQIRFGRLEDGVLQFGGRR